jgi:hypothetical protein
LPGGLLIERRESLWSLQCEQSAVFEEFERDTCRQRSRMCAISACFIAPLTTMKNPWRQRATIRSSRIPPWSSSSSE